MSGKEGWPGTGVEPAAASCLDEVAATSWCRLRVPALAIHLVVTYLQKSVSNMCTEFEVLFFGVYVRLNMIRHAFSSSVHGVARNGNARKIETLAQL
jgi:hypothetical protein